jgi:hypothetical protein
MIGLVGNCKGCHNLEEVQYTYEEIPKKQRLITLPGYVWFRTDRYSVIL